MSGRLLIRCPLVELNQQLDVRSALTGGNAGRGICQQTSGIIWLTSELSTVSGAMMMVEQH